MGGMQFNENSFRRKSEIKDFLWGRGRSDDGWLSSRQTGNAPSGFDRRITQIFTVEFSRGDPSAIANKDERIQLPYHHDIA
jgi:hypothetical protein